MDNNFSTEVRLVGIPRVKKDNPPAKEKYQFFGAIKIDGKTKAMTVSLHNIEGKKLYTVDLPNT